MAVQGNRLRILQQIAGFLLSQPQVAGELYAKAAQGPEVSFAAPGVDIWSAKAGGGYVSGTSFALPFAAAVLAAVLEGFPRSERQGVGALKTRQDLSNVLAARPFDLGESGRDKQFGWGLLQAGGCR